MSPADNDNKSLLLVDEKSVSSDDTDTWARKGYNAAIEGLFAESSSSSASSEDDRLVDERSTSSDGSTAQLEHKILLAHQGLVAESSCSGGSTKGKSENAVGQCLRFQNLQPVVWEADRFKRSFRMGEGQYAPPPPRWRW